MGVVMRLTTLPNRFLDSLSKQRNKRLLWFEIYSLVFLVTFLGVFSPLIFGNKTFIWCIDGRYQMLPWLRYVGKYVLQVIDCVVHGCKPIPLFDISMGWGDNVIGYLGSNGHMEPIAALLSALTPLIHLETLYVFLIALRLYASGLAFMYMCRYFGKDPAFAISGALVYLFNGYTLYCGTSFPYFLNAMVLLPLLIVGADEILHRRISGVFVFSVFYAGLCGFYLLYMLSVALTIFAVVRFFEVYRKGERLHAFPRIFCRAIMLYAIGFGLAAPILLPSIAELFTSARSGYNNFYLSSNIVAQWRTIWERVFALVTPKSYYEVEWGVDFPTYAAAFLPACIVMFMKSNRKSLKWLTGITLLTYLLPVGGWVMNGFQYSSNRWSFSMALLSGYIVVEMLPELLDLRRNESGILLLLLCVYTIVGVLSTYMRVSLMIPVGVAFVGITLLAVQSAGKYPLRVRRVVCVLVIGINVCVNSIYILSSDGMNWISWFEDAGNELMRVVHSMEAEGEKFPFYDNYMDGRFDSSSFVYNNSMYFGIPGSLFYSSTYNGNVVRFLEEMEGSGNQQNFKLHSTDQRTMMDTLLSVKYFLEQEDDAEYVPYGYDIKGMTYVGRNAYKNRFALPWGYTYNNSITYDEIETLNGIQKQQALLQAVALEGGDSRSRLSFEDKKVPYTLECEGCEWAEGVLTIDGNGVIKLSADILPGREYYVRLKGFDVESYRVPHRITSTWAASFDFNIQCGNIKKSSRAESSQYTCYYGRKNYLFNLGCVDKERQTVTISIPVTGTFGLEDIELYELPMTHYEEWVDDLRKEPLHDIQMDTNMISGAVDLSKDKILCLTIPYDKGWSAYVDGQKAEIFKANYAFMGLRLPEGHHEIRFEYFTVGLMPGIIICCLSLSVVIGLLIISRIKKKCKGKEL